MAKTLVFYANTAKYSFKIYDLAFTYQSFDFLPPVEVEVAEFDISYQPDDNVLPGLVPSVCTTRFFINGTTPTIDDFRTVLKTAEPFWTLEVTEGLNIVWRGFITGDLGEIEVINGKRFIKVVATDGFQMLSKKADYFTSNAVLPFTDVIATVFSFCELINVFDDGFYVSEHYQPTNSLSGFTNQGGLWITGSVRQSFIFDELEPRSSRDVIESICTTFNLQLFQDKGSLVFRSCHIKTPAWYNLYDSGGDFMGRITPPATTVTEPVYSDGTEMYKPAVAECRIRHPYYGTPYIWYVPGNYLPYDNTQVGNPVSNGDTEIDFNGRIRVRYDLPPFFGPSLVEIEVRGTFQYNGFWWNGSDWVTTPSYTTWTISTIVENPSPIETLGEEFLTINNYRMDDVPAVGSQPLFVTFESFQLSGEDLGTLSTAAQMVLEYKSGAPDYIIYIADNTSRVNGITLDLQTNVADIRQANNNILPGSIRYWPTTDRTGTSLTNAFWDAQRNEIVEIVSKEIARKAFRTHQYYELDLNGNVSYNHTFTWGGVDYKPVNLTISERSTRVTYREFIDGDLVPNPI